MQEKIFILTAFLLGSGALWAPDTGAITNEAPPITWSPENSFGPAAAPELEFLTTIVPDGQYGSAYKELNLRVIGGRAPYVFSVSGGSLPPGMSLSADGALSGTPTAAGTYPFTVAVVDNTKRPGPRSGSQAYTLLIDQAHLMITANDATTTYGGAVPTLTASYSGFVNGDDASSLTTGPTITTTATSSPRAGTYSIIAAGAADPDYSFTYISGTLTVNPAALSVTAKAATKEYGTADPTLIYTASGLVNGDNTGVLSGSLSRTPGENVGTYLITKGSLSAGSNYIVSYAGNYLTITVARQHITWKQSLLIGCNSTTKVQLTATASSGLPVTYSVSDPGVAVVSGNVLTLIRPGTAVVTAAQPGDVNHTAAPPVADTVFYQSGSLVRQHWNDVLFFDNSNGDYVQWQWYKNGEAVPAAVSPYYSETPTLNGQYFVIATNKAGKQIQSCTLTITSDTTIAGGIKVHPNPVNAGAVVTVTSNYAATALQGAVLQVVDLNGKVQQQISSVQATMRVMMPSGPGIYIINLQLANGQRATTNVLVRD